jgi:predicted polyphosphate/ATP-dependent NAD kinase
MRLASDRKVGLIVNPIAGMGGTVGLKGSDGEQTVQKARQLGATQTSPRRAIEALKKLLPLKDKFELITSPSEMGEEEAMECGFEPHVIGKIRRGATLPSDTRAAAAGMLNLRVELILFVGGDGTARDICESIGQRVPVLGVPAGVKIHSGVFGVNPSKAGELVAQFLLGQTKLQEAEVMDVDEEAFRLGRVSARLYGYLRIPYEEGFVQSTKGGSLAISDEKIAQEVIADYIVEQMEPDSYYILGPGTTTKAIADRLKTTKTLLGVDVIHGGRNAASDVNEEQLLRLIERTKGKKWMIIVSPIGQQGFILGRGNQQISPRIISKVGTENVTIISTRNKLSSIPAGRPLLVDTGDDEVNKMLSGYRRVITGYREEVVTKVAA